MTSQLSILLRRLHESPGDDLLWLAVADCLEEDGEPRRAALLRLGRRLRGMAEDAERWTLETRVRKLLAAGVRPCVPEVANGIGMRFALIPAGTFMMGSAEDEKGHRPSESPRHAAEVTRPFWMGVFPVTQADYRRVIRKGPSHFAAGGQRAADVKGLDTSGFPVEGVSWDEACGFCRALSNRAAERKAGREYRLPSEAEWEYCCRAGLASGQYHVGDRLGKKHANFDLTRLGRPCTVGTFPANAWGLHDMHGNIWEWCQDRYEADGYGRGPDESGPRERRVLRGGCWSNNAAFCRTAHRGAALPSVRNNAYGFRVCFTHS